jgi:transcriptional regulator with XRE-family HTH domain
MSQTERHFTVAQFLSKCIDESPKTQREIAKEVGWPHPNVLSMIKSGETNLPLDRIGPLAKALDIDPAHLLKLAMSQYMPETFKAVEEALGSPILSQQERDLIVAYRNLARGDEIDVVVSDLRTVQIVPADVLREIRKAREEVLAQKRE